jgi:ABC-type Fe2+-enterobactin transport system substrate-binding protein
MFKAFMESHEKVVEKQAADRLCEDEKKTKVNATSTPKHTVLSMVGLTSASWTLDMFQFQAGRQAQ